MDAASQTLYNIGTVDEALQNTDIVTAIDETSLKLDSVAIIDETSQKTDSGSLTVSLLRTSNISFVDKGILDDMSDETLLTVENSRKSEASAIRNISDSKSEALNVLFIIVDDLRAQFGADESEDRIASFDKHRMFTPHIDELSKRSLVLTRAYTQYSLCGPSRASLMTSRRPDVTKVYGNTVYWRDVGGNFTSLPQYFREHGYRTAVAGKVYHTGAGRGTAAIRRQDNDY